MPGSDVALMWLMTFLILALKKMSLWDLKSCIFMIGVLWKFYLALVADDAHFWDIGAEVSRSIVFANIAWAWLKLFIFFVAMPDTFGSHCHNNDHRCLLSKYCWQSIQRVTPPSCCRFSGIGSPQSLHSVNDGRLNFGALAMARSMDCWATSLAWSIMSVIIYHLY